jgi:small GTP-binding protein
MECKVILVGESSVGKSSIIQRYYNNEFDDVILSTVSEFFVEKALDIDGKTITLEIWDTAGQERYRTLVRQYYKESKAAILVYDITKESTFNELKNYWYKEIKENCPDISM